MLVLLAIARQDGHAMPRHHETRDEACADETGAA
jgi:hypothetical protein